MLNGHAKEEHFSDRRMELGLDEIVLLNSGRLSMEEEAVLKGIFLDELDERETAERTGIPKARVRSLTIRGLANLRRLKG